MRFIRQSKAQSSLEYIIIIACVVVALLSMRPYIQRAIQGRLRTAMDDVGEQYEPGKTSTGSEGITTTFSSHIISKVETKDAVGVAEGLDLTNPDQYTDYNATISTEEIVDETTTRTGKETVAGF